MDNSEPIPLSCPSCGAKYKIVTIDSPAEAPYSKVACLRCDALFPAGDGRVFFKYILIGPPRRKQKQ
jgi:predicted Zn finger-like uncharacterized protein